MSFFTIVPQAPFDAQDKKIGYDNTIMSCFNLLFGMLIGKDNLNLFLILSYSAFDIFILSFWWVRVILSWLTLKILILPSLSSLMFLSDFHPSTSTFFHNYSTPSLLFVTDQFLISLYNHFFSICLIFCLFFFLLSIYFLFLSNLKRDETGWSHANELWYNLVKEEDCKRIFYFLFNSRSHDFFN